MRLAYFALALVVIVPSAHASFDMMLVSETLSSGTRIHRIDPTNGAYLGWFAGPGTLTGAVTNVVGSAVNHSAYVKTVNALYQYDYSSGALIRSISVAGNSLTISVDQSALYVGSSTSIVSLNPTTLATTSTVVSSVNVVGLATNTNGNIFASVGDGTLKTYSGTGTLLGSTPLPISRQVSLMRNAGLSSYADELLGANGTSSANYGFIAGNVCTGGGAESIAGFGSVLGSASAHVGGYWFGADSTTSSLARIAHVSERDDAIDNTFTTTSFSISTSTRVGIVLAPEPGTWAAMGLGIVALARRRRRS